MMIRDGYAGVTVDEIAQRVGIGRTTVFRYFGSKSGIIWSAFDETNTQLRLLLTPPVADMSGLDVVRTAIYGSTQFAIYRSDVWLERFELLDRSPQLRADAYSHWEAWKQAIETYLATELGTVAPQTAAAIAGACQSIFVSELRDVRTWGPDREAFLARLDASLERLLRAVSTIV